ncbi:MAG: sigma-54-dependent Fis family transcriptional regulator [Bacteroidetes bacterium]|nr:sigma-54-dependent Fis family transcriptional regulator [Bacteroidota bacterium]
MKTSAKILVADDDEDVLLAASMVLKKEFSEVRTLKNPEKITPVLRKESYDVILLDMNFSEDTTSGREGFFWLRNILALQPDAVVVLITAYGGIEMAVQAIKDGAFDFVLKPWQNEKLISTVHAALRLRNSESRLKDLESENSRLNAIIQAPETEFIGSGPLMQKVFQTISKVAATDANVLITGENGSGKELVARALHMQSQRKNKPFIAVDLGSLSGSLFESELFGHAKGAFTDARDDKAGRFEMASGGSIFLDEIGNVPLHLQSKLLTVLQSRNVTRVGDNKSRPFDARIISATNINPVDAVQQGQFRQDLLYRINTVEIKLPALRERREDIPHLATYFKNLYSLKYKKPIRDLSRDVLIALESCNWPGNVRELQHTIERAVILCENSSISVSDLGDLSKHTLQENKQDLSGSGNLEEMEKRTIELALQRYRGNISQTALELGISRAALYRRMEKYGL